MKQHSELAAADAAELQKRLGDLRRELIKLNAQVATGTVPKSPGQIRKTKRTIARILTVLRQRELAALVHHTGPGTAAAGRVQSNA